MVRLRMSIYIEKFTRLASEAWNNQSDQVQQWRHGDAFSGAIAGLGAITASFKLPMVRKKAWNYMIPNLLVMVSMTLAFLVLHGIILFICYLIGLVGWAISPPTLVSTFQLAIWIQIGLWSTLLSNVFYNSAEDCFYSRLNDVDHQGLIQVHRWEENWSFLSRTWTSFKRTIK